MDIVGSLHIQAEVALRLVVVVHNSNRLQEVRFPGRLLLKLYQPPLALSS